MCGDGDAYEDADGGGTDGGVAEADVDGDEETPRERAKRLATQLRFLRMREQSANFEDLEAIRREIRRKERELTRLAEAAEFDVDVEVRRE